MSNNFAIRVDLGLRGLVDVTVPVGEMTGRLPDLLAEISIAVNLMLGIDQDVLTVEDLAELLKPEYRNYGAAVSSLFVQLFRIQEIHFVCLECRTQRGSCRCYGTGGLFDGAWHYPEPRHSMSQYRDGGRGWGVSRVDLRTVEIQALALSPSHKKSLRVIQKKLRAGGE